MATEFRAAATWMARSRSCADCPTSALNAMVMTVANTVAASSRLSNDSAPRLSRGFCSRVPVASGSSEASGLPVPGGVAAAAAVGGASDGTAPAGTAPGGTAPGGTAGGTAPVGTAPVGTAPVGGCRPMPNARTTGEPNHRLGPLTFRSAIAWSPGASVSVGGTNRKRSTSSASVPASGATIVVFPEFSKITPNVPELPPTTVIGVRVSFSVSLGGTTSSTSAIAIACGGVSSRTWTAIRRSPAATPGGIRISARTVSAVSGNSERFSVSSTTQEGSAPSTRRW